MTTLPAALENLRGTIGIWTFAHELVAPKESAAITQFAATCGFSGYWYPEAYGREAFTNAGLLLAGSNAIVVGSSIASIWGRDAMAAANGARTLTAAFGDRFVLGLGVSHKPLVESIRGHDYVNPLTAMSAYLDAVNEATMFAPEASERSPRLIAALGPRMLSIAAEKADGAMPYLVTPEHTVLARQTLGDGPFLVVEQAVALTDDEHDFRARAAQHLERYTSLPNYQNNWRRLGFTDEDFIPGGSARLQDALVVRGDEEAIQDQIDAHRSAGADHVALQILGSDPMALPEDDWRRVGALVQS